MPNVSIPKIEKKETASFAKVWNKGGVAIILDDTAISFATDWANIVLRSFIEDQVKKAVAMQQKFLQEAAAQQAANVAATAKTDVPATPATTKGLIQLTDM